MSTPRNNIITWSRATAQSMLDFEPDELFQPATEEFKEALERAIQEADGSDGAVIYIQVNP